MVSDCEDLVIEIKEGWKSTTLHMAGERFVTMAGI